MSKLQKGWNSDLTCERLGNRFTSMFDLVKHAKRVAEGMVYADRMPERDNIAASILGDIANKREVMYETTPRQEDSADIDAAIQAAQALNAASGAAMPTPAEETAVEA